MVQGPSGGRPLVMHHGTPGVAMVLEPVAEAAARYGMRFVTHSRPGYRDSSPQRGRRVAEVAGDVGALLDAVGADDFVTLGWSGGGPHALACAALLPERCRGAAIVAGVAPYDAEGLDWLAGMGAENVAEFGAAATGVEALGEFLAEAGSELRDVQADDIITAFGDLLSAVDQQTLRDGLAGYLAASCRAAVSRGYDGWRDDDLAFLTDWGIDLARIRVPVSIWQGDQDRMVPRNHGRWLGEHVAGATTHLVPGEGHLSLMKNIDTIMATLAQA
ncbi:pimeloyl-ACP methyl ester carboxylesterase [Kribbella orskensis]|uniref:Pimeloyl-ACP methyl ester carboxylesterase n=2 Tax=Kribbellaceae TaxID=2726069 RepID=A0ABY2BMB2_9ACTN|nr:pimeloyl-ACP methyl ester carboxylesterase [Kribbella sp. VKM Ac-2500]TCO25556.1 pimeloyl-ACP methyl ester carboxylesterase [Kribbella orskensis]